MNQARMSPERWREIKPLLESALELKAADRSAFLDENCDHDKPLRREVESLLDASEQAGDFMSKPVIEGAARWLAKDNAFNKRWLSVEALIDEQWDFPLASGLTQDVRHPIESRWAQAATGPCLPGDNPDTSVWRSAGDQSPVSVDTGK